MQSATGFERVNEHGRRETRRGDTAVGSGAGRGPAVECGTDRGIEDRRAGDFDSRDRRPEGAAILDGQRAERQVPRCDDGDHVVAVGIVVDPRNPGRIRWGGVAEGGQPGQDQDQEQGDGTAVVHHPQATDRAHVDASASRGRYRAVARGYTTPLPEDPLAAIFPSGSVGASQASTLNAAPPRGEPEVNPSTTASSGQAKWRISSHRTSGMRVNMSPRNARTAPWPTTRVPHGSRPNDASKITSSVIIARMPSMSCPFHTALNRSTNRSPSNAM